MTPIQEIDIRTKKARRFLIHLEKWAEDRYECKMAAINLGPQLPADATFGPFSTGTIASEAYASMIDGLQKALSKLDPSDSIETIDNPCNTELLSHHEQSQLVGRNVTVSVNGTPYTR